MKYILLLTYFIVLIGCSSDKNKNTEATSAPSSPGGEATSDSTSETTEPPSTTGNVKFLYITNESFKTVSKINLDSFTLVKNISTGKTPDILAVSDDGNFVVVNDREGQYLTFIDTKNDSTKNVSLSVTNITDIKISKTSRDIFILSSDKQMEVIYLDESLAIASQEIISLVTNPNHIEVSDNFVTLFGSSDTTLLYFNPSTPSLINQASVCNAVNSAKFYATDMYIFLVCKNEFIIFNLENNVLLSSETLDFIPDDMITNSNNTTFYMVTTNSSNNIIMRNYTSFDEPITFSETRASVSDLSSIKMLFYHQGEKDTTPKLLILSNNELIALNLSTNEIASRHALYTDPLKVHDYKDALFITHANSLGLVTKINVLSSLLTTLEGFALEGWFDR